ncbi:MAG: DegV family protein, partial [Oscillospiraceae bacterium]
FVLENLDNLVKNGRMNKITGTLATVMNIRPILGSDANGNIASYSKSRGSIQALEKLCGLIGKHATSTSDKTLVITHCNNNEGAKTFEKLVEKFYKFKDIIILPTRGLSSMYANEGGIIIAF